MNKKNIISILCLIVIIGLSFAFAKQKISVQADTELHGWAWGASDDTGSAAGVGWISLNCADPKPEVCGKSDYKVTYDSSGNLSGYAWAGNGTDGNGNSLGYGWLRFNPGFTGPDGNGTGAKMNLSTGVVTGWARFCNGYADYNACSGADSPDWTGWVDMRGLTIGSGSLTYSPSEFGKSNSFAWANALPGAGWISFDAAMSNVSCSGTLPSNAVACSAVGSGTWHPASNNACSGDVCEYTIGGGGGCSTDPDNYTCPCAPTTASCGSVTDGCDPAVQVCGNNDTCFVSNLNPKKDQAVYFIPNYVEDADSYHWSFNKTDGSTFTISSTTAITAAKFAKTGPYIATVHAYGSDGSEILPAQTCSVNVKSGIIINPR